MELENFSSKPICNMSRDELKAAHDYLESELTRLDEDPIIKQYFCLRDLNAAVTLSLDAGVRVRIEGDFKVVSWKVK